ncbi:MAG TPA: hypothetical protein VLZ07_04380 [Syntrophales bacterium]|nr:hypothetical protein [Syntrophales bacterium]
MKTEITGSRRAFIKNAAIFAGLAALLGWGDRPAAATTIEPRENNTQESQGYRLTEHVKKYYETARE